MKEDNDIRSQDPKKIEKELGEFLNKKFGGTVKIISPSALPQQDSMSGTPAFRGKKALLNFNLKPTELIAYLDQYVVRQDTAKSVLATKICTHFNRIRHSQVTGEGVSKITGNIKSNILMLGPTGIGKTYLIKLIAKKIGKKIWKKYFKFAIVRNPYDMVVSRYFWNKKNITPRAKPGAVWREIGQEPLAGHLYKKFIFSCYRSLFHKDLQPDDDFRTFVLKKLPGNISNNKYYFDKQGRPLNDLVIRYENLDEDYKKVCEKINIPYEPLPQLKTKTRQKNSYRELYDQELKNLITKKFKKEIEYFNYQF